MDEPAMTVDDVRRVEFTVVRGRRRGYAMPETDVLLDAVVVAMEAGRPVTPLIPEVIPWGKRAGYRTDEVDAVLDRLRGTGSVAGEWGTGAR